LTFANRRSKRNDFVHLSSTGNPIGGFLLVDGSAVAEDSAALYGALERRLAATGQAVARCNDLSRLPRIFNPSRHAVVIVWARADASDRVFAAMREIRCLAPVPVVLVVTEGSEQLATAALRAGVADYFSPPFSIDDLVESVERCVERTAAQNVGGRRVSAPLSGAAVMLGESQSIASLRQYIMRVAASDANVLITGETGTGKELAAEMIHRNSPRRDQRLVSINCAAIPSGLLESELFGHERGAFTGAHVAREGQLELADGGTVFFDEIGDMDAPSQAKVLRVAEGKPVYRVGGRRPLQMKARIIAATNHDLERSMHDGMFRKDLYFRLNVARIHLPPLRDRREDIPMLLNHYLGELNRRFHATMEGFTEPAMERLIAYDWPGNVRELKNTLEAIFISSQGSWIDPSALPERVRGWLQEASAAPAAERDRLISALTATNWNKTRAAEKLHWSRMTLYRKLAKYHLVKTGASGQLVP
jgi:DNA-binding NtrC family response regulator